MQNPLTTLFTPVLSLDGGGTRALLFLQVLKYIEKATRKRTAELFQLISGTSAGGIVALALTCSEPKMSAADVETLFLQVCPSLFKPGPIQSLTALLSPKYDQTPLHTALIQHMGLTKLSQADTNLLITTFCLNTFQPVYLTNIRPAKEPDYDWDWYAVDAACATSAGPTLFPPYAVGDSCFVDGGLLANNPAMLALHLVQDHHNPLLLSLGTGVPTEGWSYNESKGWGEIAWIGPVLNICMDGATKQVHEQCASVLPPDTYLRAQWELTGNSTADQSTPMDLGVLVQLGQTWVDNNKEALDQFIGKLMGEKG